MPKMRNKITEANLYSKEVLTAYYHKQLSEQDERLLEQAMEQDPFLKEAYEGFVAQPQGIKELDNLGNKFNNKNKLLYFGGAILVFFIAFIYLVRSNPFVTKEQENLPQQELVQKQEAIESKPKKIEPLEEEKQIVYTQMIKEEKQRNRNNKPIDIKELSPKDKKTLSFPKVETKSIQRIELETPVELATEKIPLVSLQGLIHVNYQKIRETPKTLENKVVYGLPADKEKVGGEQETNLHKLQQKQIPYNTYLSEVQTHFRKNQYQKAIEGYTYILTQYPDDLNAHFYSAICYYNLGELQQALSHLEIVLVHPYNTFREEGEWYKSLVLYEMGKEKEAKQLWTIIAKKKGFYAEQAKQKLR